MAGTRPERPPFLPGPLDPAPGSGVELDLLVRFVEHPVKAFLRQRLGLYLPDAGDEVDDRVPIELDALETWGVGDRVLQAVLRGADLDRALEAEYARGSLPPGELKRPLVEQLRVEVHGLAAVAETLFGDEPGTSAEVRVGLGERTVAGTVPGVCGAQIRLVTYSRLGPKHRLAAWVRLLALTAARPEHPWETTTLGRGPRKTGPLLSRISSVGDDPAARRAWALDELGVLVDLRDRGLREPLPLVCKTSAAWAESFARGRNPFFDARDEWETGFGAPFDREDREPEHELAFGAGLRMGGLADPPAAPSEPGPIDEPSRFGRLARRLWDPLLAAERLERP